MKRTPMFQAAASALLFSLSCAPDDVAQDGSTSTGTATGAATESNATEPEPETPRGSLARRRRLPGRRRLRRGRPLRAADLRRRVCRRCGV
ncbi:hypothetical protein [Nannocystis sp.]|uniref:hypothetical protein n=1 Tax=Nannocystis sp. TaxID=1962667 RepID=UPI0025DA1672|nr:hypothetical protein [Nannocystis sp.]MBK7829370.1 hypothetical protein [Nannocystis sp.]